jgi:hypothetical protein
VGVDDERGHADGNFMFRLFLVHAIKAQALYLTYIHILSVNLITQDLIQKMSRSRGDRAIAPGNLSSSMRENYGELGVSEVSTGIMHHHASCHSFCLLQYYKKIGSTYRNPHFPGIRLCIFSWLNRFDAIRFISYLLIKMNRWWHMDGCNINTDDRIFIFDMACGL